MNGRLPRRPRLDQWLAWKGWSPPHFAEVSGIPRSTVYRILDGYDTSGRHWARIAKTTGGAVRPEHHFPVGT